MTLLVICAAVYGVLAGYLFARLTRIELLRGSLNRIAAHLLEFRLFIDEPSTVFRAQRDLFRENLRLLGAIALPCALTGMAFFLLYRPFDSVLGSASLPVGATAVITSKDRVVQPPWGTVIDAPAVHVALDRTVSQRVRVTGPNTLGHQPWITEFALISALAGAVSSTRLQRIRFWLARTAATTRS